MLVVLLALAFSAPFQRPGESHGTPKGRWTAEGGDPAHSGVSSREPLRAPIEVAWSVDVGGVIESEPLVWDGQVLVAAQVAKQTRELRIFDLVTGAEIARPTSVRAAVELEPSIGSGSIAYRSAADEITSARLLRGALRTMWKCEASKVGPPLATHDAVYVAGASGLSRRALARDVEAWRVDGVLTGAPAIDGGDVLAVELRRNVAYLVRVDCATGTKRSASLLGPLRGEPSADFRVSSFSKCAFVQLGATLDTADPERDIRMLGLKHESWSDSTLEVIPWSAALRHRPVPYRDRWLAELTDGAGVAVLASMLDDDSGEFMQLASATTHPELVDRTTPPTIMGSQAIVGATAIDLESRSIVWRAPVAPTERGVAADGAVLFVDGGRRLVAVRTKAARVDVAVTAEADAAMPGVIALRSGEVEWGDFRVQRDAARIVRAGADTSAGWPMSQVLLLADGDGLIYCGVEPLRGVAAVARAERGRELLELAGDAKSAGDIDLLERWIDEALEAGVSEYDVAKLEQYAANARKSRNRPSVKAELVAQTLARRAELERRDAQVTWRFAQALLGEQRDRYFVELARRTLEVDPSHEAAREAVRRLVPLDLRPSGEFDPFDALDLISAIRRTPIRVSSPAETGAARNAAQEELEKRRESWRQDLLAIESRDLIVVTPVRTLGALAQLLAYGEMTCAALDELYGVQPDAVERAPLLVELYESRREYVDAVRRAHAEGARDLEQTRGHYDLLANVSRFYMDESDADRAEVLETTAHELTHHWLRARSPSWPCRDVTPLDVRSPGLWVVEGMACLVGGFDFDRVGGSWSPGGERSERLDLVAHGTDSTLMPWETFFTHSYQSHDRWKLERVVEIPVSLQLGVLARPTAIDLFYAQSEATAHYLFTADGGALRPTLFEFLADYYSGRSDKLDLPARLGVSAAELGRRISEHCKSVLR